jgi:hypothetical protein
VIGGVAGAVWLGLVRRDPDAPTRRTPAIAVAATIETPKTLTSDELRSDHARFTADDHLLHRSLPAVIALSPSPWC